MMGSDLIFALSLLSEIDPPEITWQGILGHERRTDFEALIGLGALVHVGNADAVLCLACNHPHLIAIEFTGNGGYRAYCHDSGYQDVRAEVLRRFAVDPNWFVAMTSSALGLPRSGTNTALPLPIVRVGRTRFGPYACELFVGTRLSDKKRFEDARKAISLHLGKAPAIVLTTTPLDLVPGDLPPRCALLPIGAVLQFSEAGKALVDDTPIYAALRGPRPLHSGGIGFSFSSGFRAALVGDQEYLFTDKQALAVEALYKATLSGTKLHQSEIQGAADTTQRMAQLFARHPAYNSLIKGDGNGYYTLNL